MILLLLLPLANSLIIPFDSKLIDYSDSSHLGKGAFGVVSSVKINNHSYAAKKQSYREEAINELSIMLFAASNSSKYVIPITFAFLTRSEVTIGMPKMTSNAYIINKSRLRLNSQEKLAASRITDETFFDLLSGVAELNKMGIFRADNKLENTLLDQNGRAFVADFSTSLLVTPLSVDYYRLYKGNFMMTFDMTGFSEIAESFETFFKNRKIKSNLDWKKLKQEFTAEDADRMSTVHLVRLLREGKYRKFDEK